MTTTYYYDGSRLVAEQNDNETIVYIYDASGAVIGMQYRASTYAKGVYDIYWFEKNILGDVTAVWSDDGVRLISYVYDAWGDTFTRYYNGGNNSTAKKNSMTYRGYYFDSDLQLYYLSTRYYDYVTGRFISPDDLSYLGANGDILSYNLYAYCSNNPIMFTDPSGHAAAAIIAGVIIGGAVVGGLLGAATSAINGEDVWKGAAVGVITGGAASALGILMPTKYIVVAAIIGFVAGMGADAAVQAIDIYTQKGSVTKDDIDWFQASKTGIITMIGAIIPPFDKAKDVASLAFGTALAWGEASALIWATDTILSQIFGW